MTSGRNDGQGGEVFEPPVLVDPCPDWDARDAAVLGGPVFEEGLLDPVVIARMDAAGVLEAAAEQQSLRRVLERSRLLLAWRLACTYEALPDVPAALADAPPSRVRLIRVAGEGAALVHEHAPLELAVALGLSPEGGRQLMGAAVELATRLPRMWDRVIGGRLEAWRAGEIARETLALDPATAAAVDELLDQTHRALNGATTADLVLEALLVLDPEEAARREARHDQDRGVFVTPPTGPAAVPGLPARWAEVHARLDAPDAAALDTTLDQIARILAHHDRHQTSDGSIEQQSHQQYRATALGLLADPHAAADLLDTGLPAGATGGRPRRPATLYVHCEATDLATLVSGSGGIDHGARIETYGPATLALVRRWLDRHDVTLRPVLDMSADPLTDSYTPPEAMQEQTVLRDATCTVPGCPRPARACDTDHDHPWDPGPDHPGQTRPSNLESRCRPHHRMKTHSHHRFRALVRRATLHRRE